jgi:hypothetical protein
MAEINLERKRGPSAWVWIIGLIVLAIILWAIFGHSRTRTASRSTADVVAEGGVGVSGTSGVHLVPGYTVAVLSRAA